MSNFLEEAANEGLVNIDWYDYPYEYDLDYYTKKKKKKFHECKFCGKKGLIWIEEQEDKWRLYEKDTPHICGPKTGYENNLIY